jgi:O-glycosyl hydrolase
MQPSKKLPYLLHVFWVWAVVLTSCMPPLQSMPAPTGTAPEPSATSLPASAVPTSSPSPLAQTQTPVPNYRELVVSPDQPRQTMREVGGGNFINYFGQARTSFEPVSELNWQTLTPKVMRVGMELGDWEPKNDNTDPGEANADGFIDEPESYIRATFELMRRAQADRAVIIASIWRIPAWLVENPEDENGKIVIRDNYPELVESITTWLLRARDEYGVNVDYISFNEANLGITVLFSPTDAIELIRQAGARFDAQAISSKWLLGDTSNMAEAVAYSEPIWNAGDIRPYLGPLAFHSWDSGAGDGTLEEIGSFAEKNGLEVWCTEAGWDSSQWQRSKEFPTWSHALNLAAIYTRTLKSTRASTYLYWQMSGDDYAINNGVTPYPALVILAEIQKKLPHGAVVVQTGKDFGGITYVAAKVDGGVNFLAVNSSLKETFIVRGLPDGIYDLKIANRELKNELVGTVEVKNGSGVVELQSFSVTFLSPHKP